MDYKAVIESRYNRQNWLLLLHDIFGSKAKFWNTPSAVQTSSPFARQAIWLGTITLSDEQTIAIYEVELADSVDIERNRRGIRDMLLTDWRNKGNAGAFMFCYRQNESVLRFSYVSESWKFADDGSLQKESTDTKRFTYLLGEGHRSRTAIQQFEKLRDSKLALQDLTKAFSVEAVSNMFFQGYKQQYEDIIFFVTGKRMVKVANKWEERQEGTPNAFIMQQFDCFANPEKAVRDYVKKLMGRLVFLQYLQKKGWLGVPVSGKWGDGDLEFIQHLFDKCADKDHFVDNVLEILFNDLNTKREGDLATPSIGGDRGRLIPYLNGGLFERETSDDTEFPLPAKYMQNLLDFFASYNFTIDENDPDDAEVGVDPEMLGRIFENLLEDNKDKGAFYTPKEIVQYMCRESLISYLQTDVEDKPTKEAIRQFVTTHDADVLGNIADDIDQLLKDVKICDPAIGSGAFPMGLLKELFLCRTAIEGFSQEKAAEIKKHIIQQNIYGVDIERGAVDIARLRFWLALIVDEETPQALPNLDFKIMQGNSLLEQYKGVDLSTMTEKKADATGMLTIFDDMLDVYRKELRDMLAKYYNCPDHNEKAKLREKIVNNVKLQLREQIINVDFGDLDLSGNSEFMLWHTWFYDVFTQGGFDIVIGNPPYVQLQNNGGQLAAMYDKCDFFCYAKTGDIYSLFYEQGNILLRKNGHLCFITSNKWMRAGYGEKLREYLSKNTNPQILIDFAGVKVFDDATVDTNILLFEKNNNEGKTISCVASSITKETLSNLNHVVQNESTISKFETANSWIILTPFEQKLKAKIEKGNKRLGEMDLLLSRGVGTGFDEAFFLSEEEKNCLLGQCKTTKELEKTKQIIYPLLRGRDIKRYNYNWSNLWIIYIPLHFPLEKDSNIKGASKKAEELFQSEYPALYSHLRKYKDKLSARDKKETGIRYEWYCIQRPRYDKFKKLGFPKIVYQELSQGSPFAVDIEGRFLLSNSAYFIASTNITFLTGLLNSHLIEYSFDKFYSTKLGSSGIRWLAQNIIDIPIPTATEYQRSQISKLVEQILEVKRIASLHDTSSLESEIDRLVYQLYGLTYEEILIIDPETPIKREEYESNN